MEDYKTNHNLQGHLESLPQTITAEYSSNCIRLTSILQEAIERNRSAPREGRREVGVRERPTKQEGAVFLGDIKREIMEMPQHNIASLLKELN